MNMCFYFISLLDFKTVQECWNSPSRNEEQNYLTVCPLDTEGLVRKDISIHGTDLDLLH